MKRYYVINTRFILPTNIWILNFYNLNSNKIAGNIDVIHTRISSNLPENKSTTLDCKQIRILKSKNYTDVNSNSI